jgi:hypothetical protein
MLVADRNTPDLDHLPRGHPRVGSNECNLTETSSWTEDFWIWGHAQCDLRGRSLPQNQDSNQKGVGILCISYSTYFGDIAIDIMYDHIVQSHKGKRANSGESKI